MLSFTLNGVPQNIEVDPRLSTLDLLREHLGISSLKAGCAPQGLCGCCLVLINGQPRLSCTLPNKSLAGKEVQTQEGLPEEKRNLLASCFAACSATACGYCTPGILTHATALLTNKPELSEEDLKKSLNLHLCRCTGYSSIVDAIQRAGAVLRGQAEAPQLPEAALDAPRGEKIFVDDLVVPGMLAGALAFAPAGQGKIRRLDSAATRAEVGVLAVVELRREGDLLEWPGEPVVAVAAVDSQTAQKAAAKVVVEMEPLTSQEPILRLRARRVEGEEVPLLHRATVHLRLPFTDPVFLEPEAALADGGRLFSAADDLFSAFSGRSLQLRQLPSGGSYGGRIAGVIEEAALRLSAATGKPVKVACSLEEGMRLHLRRPAAELWLEGGLTEPGELGLIRGRVRIDGGCSAREGDVLVAQVLEALPYVAGRVELEVELWEGAGPRTGPVRGGAAVGLVVALEQLLDQLAAAAGQDGLSLRRRAASPELRPLLEALEPAWALEGPRRGIALGRMEGRGGAEVWLRVVSDAEVEVSCSVPDFGQGRDVRILQALVEETGLSPNVFVFPFGSSAQIPGSAPWSATVGEAARMAARALRAGGGPLKGRIGATFYGCGGRQAPGLAAALAVASAEGVIEKVYVAGAVPDDALSRSLLEGAAHMGAGLALSEEMEPTGGFLFETRLRMLGVIKSKAVPQLIGVSVPDGADREPTEAALLASTGAISALMGVEQLPARDSLAAKVVGARPRATTPLPPA